MGKLKEYLKSKKEAIVKVIDGVIDLLPLGNKVTEFMKSHKVTFLLVAGVLIDLVVSGASKSGIVELVGYVFQLVQGG